MEGNITHSSACGIKLRSASERRAGESIYQNEHNTRSTGMPKPIVGFQ